MTDIIARGMAAGVEKRVSVLEDKILAAISFKGSITFNELKALTNAAVGDMYNITDEFEWGGITYEAGTNLACIQAFETALAPQALVEYWDTFGTSKVDLTPYETASHAAATYATQTALSTEESARATADATLTSGLNTTNAALQEAQSAISGKQDALVSGTNIKTINGNSLLGSGNITIQGAENAILKDTSNILAGDFDIAGVGDPAAPENTPIISIGAYVPTSEEDMIGSATAWTKDALNIMYMSEDASDSIILDGSEIRIYQTGSTSEGGTFSQALSLNEDTISMLRGDPSSGELTGLSLSDKQAQLILEGSTAGIQFVRLSEDGIQLAAMNGVGAITDGIKITNTDVQLLGSMGTANTSIATKQYVDNNSGPTYAAGSGIAISNNTISVDSSYVALKSDLAAHQITSVTVGTDTIDLVIS